MAAKTIESVLQENRVFPPPDAFVKKANISGMDAYGSCARRPSATSRDSGGVSRKSTARGTSRSRRCSTRANAPFFKWFEDGELNASYNCLDRHLKTQPDKTAIIFEADDGKVTRITYRELHRRVCMFANGLKSLGHQEGRPRDHLHADVDRGGRGDAGVRAHRRDSFGRVRRLLGEEPAGAHHRRRRCGRAHRRRADPRRARRSRSRPRWTRRSRWAAANRSRRSSSTSAPAAT